MIYDVQRISRGVRLTFSGFNHKLLDFASYISANIFSAFRDL